MKNGTRERIFDYLKRNQSAGADEIARALGMTGANIRHHLGIMAESGQITMVEKRIEGKGRPVIVYRLSEALLGNGYAVLVEAMSKAWLERLNENEKDGALRALAEVLSGGAGSDQPTSMQRKLALLIEKLNQMHYQAKWEAGAGGARIILGHCPYAEIIARHPELCRMDRSMLESQLNQPVKQLTKLERNPAGLPVCIFVAG